MDKNQSEVILIDGLDISAGPVCRMKVPHRISSGTHACWCPRELMNGGGRQTVSKL